MHVHPFIHSELSRQRELELRAKSAPRHAPEADRSLDPIVRAAASGDRRAWEVLIGRFGPILHRVVNGYRLRHADVDDVVQATWESAFTHIADLRDPQAVGGWLCIIARREALRSLSRQRREIVVEDASVSLEPDEATPERSLVDKERARIVSDAVERLPAHQRILVATLLHDSESSYSEVAQKLGVPIGSIGPTRGRALAHLRRDPELTSWSRSSRQGSK